MQTYRAEAGICGELKCLVETVMQVIARRYLDLENANATRTARSDYAKIYRPGGADGKTGGRFVALRMRSTPQKQISSHAS
jgi:hypothetical protein